MMTGSLHGHIALVTGGSRGIGAAIVRSLAEAGATVAVNFHERVREADTLVKAISEAGGHAIAIAADVSQSDAVAQMVQRVKSDLGPIDILINNAGIAIPRGLDDLPMMRTKKWGRIVNISSGAARGAGSIGPHYNASKAGIEGLTRGYAARLVKEGITVNAVAPSLIQTDMMKGQDNLASRIPLGRFGKAEEVAQAVIMLLNNPYMTGQTVAMSGGMAFN